MQQARGEEGGGYQRNHGAGCPGNECSIPHGTRKRLGGRGNHHRVVSAQRQIHHEDGERAKNELPMRQLMEWIQTVSLACSPRNEKHDNFKAAWDPPTLSSRC